jgi:5'-nucleotidase
MKRSLPLVLFLALGCSTFSTPSSEPVHVVFVATTDLHGWFNGHVETPRPGEAGVLWGGLPTLASFVDVLRDEHPGRVVLLDAGDMFQGTLESNIFEGIPVIRGYNMLGYAAAAVGNHEFDFGPEGADVVARTPDADPLGALKRNAALANFPLLSANMTDKETGQVPSWARPYTIVSVKGARIGIIGLSTPDTPNVTMTANVTSLNFGDPVKATIEAAAELRAKGVDAVVVVAHIGGRCTNSDEPHDPSSCDRQQEAIRYLNELPRGTIDAFFGGHSHSSMRHFVNGVPAVEALAFSREFATLDLWIDRQANKVLPEKTVIRPHTMICSYVYSGTEMCDPTRAAAGASLVRRRFGNREIRPHPDVAAGLDPYLRRVAAKRVEKLGFRATARFSRAYSAESPLGNLLADALRESTGADVAFMNSGGIRNELPAGDLVYSDVFEVSPFDNYPAMTIMTGAQLVEALQATTTGVRGVMQVSGLKYTYDAAKDQDKPPAERRRLVSVTMPDGSPLDLERKFNVVMPDFVAAGGDGMAEVMKGVPPAQVLYGKPIREVLIDVVRARGTTTLSPVVEGRITVLNEAQQTRKN